MRNKNKITTYPSYHYAMSIKQKQITILTTLGVLIVITTPAVYLFLLALSPLTFGEMDFDDNGFVTFSELIHANSNCHRLVLDGRVVCNE
jgi:hypothetical protein